MFQYFKYAAKGLASLILIGCLALLTYIYFEEDALAERMSDALCQSITTDIHTENASLDIFTHFPNITIAFEQVVITDTRGDQLLIARRLEGSINPLHLLTQHLEISTLGIADGTLNIHRTESGEWNYTIFTRKEDDKTDSSFSFNISKANLKNVALRYIDEQGRQEYNYLVANGKISGEFTPSGISVSFNFDGLSQQLSVDQLSFCSNTPLSLEGHLFSDQGEGLVILEDIEIGMKGTGISLDGTVHGFKSFLNLNLNIAAEVKRIPDLIESLPIAWHGVLKKYAISGATDIKGEITGRMSENENPKVDLDFQVKDGSFRAGLSEEGFRQVQAEGHFDNGPFRNLASSVLTVTRVTAKSFGHKLDGSLTLNGLSDPYLTTRFSGPIPVALLFEQGNQEQGSSTGFLQLKQATIENLWLRNMDFTDLKQISAEGTANQIEIQLGNEQLSLPSGTWRLSEDTLHLQDFAFQYEQSRGVIEGFLTGLGDFLESTDPAYAHYKLNAEMGTLVLENFLPLPAILKVDASSAGTSQSVSNTRHGKLGRFPTGLSDIHAEKFRYGSLSGKDIDLNIGSSTDSLHFTANWNGMDGRIKSEGTFESTDQAVFEGQVQCEDIDIESSFKQLGNFNQHLLTNDNLSGKADLHMLVRLPFASSGSPSWELMHVVGGIAIEDGELKDLEILEQFSRYIHSEDLQHIRFGRLENFFEIKNEHVYFPVLFIRSNAINLAVNGIHGFDNDVAYNLKLNGGQVATSKLRRHNPSLRPQEARKEGTFNLYYRLFGNVADIQYATDRNGVQTSFRQSEEWRRKIKQQLERGFGIPFDFIEPEDWEDIPEYQGTSPDRSPKYLDRIEGQ